ncbi:MAG: hypothetical protein EBX61_05550, partial [Betaproteobacteria bacterium]|nr:hypothetical protein [Betaproteobacteria bacterium]
MDIKNAFNSISRQAIFDTLHINPELGPLQHLLYAKPNQVIYPGYVNVQDNSGRSVKKPIKYVQWATRGTTQGSPEGGISYIAVHDRVIEKVKNAHQRVTMCGIYDDWYFMGEWKDVAEA